MTNGEVDYPGHPISIISILSLIIHCLSGILSSLENMLTIGDRKRNSVCHVK